METTFVTIAPRFLLVLLLISFAFQKLDADSTQRGHKLSKEEHSELDRQLKLINKPPIKSIQVTLKTNALALALAMRTEYGDIIDCVDIYKQLAFDHPLLKNHNIQMKPMLIPKGIKYNASRTEDDASKLVPHDISCPKGSVPIKRATKEDLIMANYAKSVGLINYLADSSQPNNSTDTREYHFAELTYITDNSSLSHGAKGDINVWEPSVSHTQYSTSSITLLNGPAEELNYIQAGWGVNYFNYPDKSRLHILWTADGLEKTGCFNLLCPGFVQVSRKIAVGMPLTPISTYGGPQYLITLNLHQDNVTGNWLFMVGDEYVGYWPKEVFTSLASGALKITWGGSVHSPINEPSPAMGSGHFSNEKVGKSAFVKEIQIVTPQYSYVDPDIHSTGVYSDDVRCYDVQRYNNGTQDWGFYIFYGGPGNCTYLQSATMRVN